MEATFNEKQLQIMHKALEIFSEKGYNGSSVRDIAQQAQVNVAMISYYFGSKDKLLEAIFIDHAATINQKLQEIINNTSLDPIAKIDVIIDTMVSIMIKRKDFNRVMMRESVLFKEGGNLFNIVLNMKNQSRSLVSEAVLEGQEKGIFNKNVDIDFILILLMGSLNYLISNDHFILCRDNLTLKHALTSKLDIEKFKSQLKIMYKAYLTYEM